MIAISLPICVVFFVQEQQVHAKCTLCIILLGLF